MGGRAASLTYASALHPSTAFFDSTGFSEME